MIRFFFLLLICPTLASAQHNPPVSRYAGSYLIIMTPIDRNMPRTYFNMWVKENGDILWYESTMTRFRDVITAGQGETDNFGRFYLQFRDHRDNVLTGRFSRNRSRSYGRYDGPPKCRFEVFPEYRSK